MLNDFHSAQLKMSRIRPLFAVSRIAAGYLGISLLACRPESEAARSIVNGAAHQNDPATQVLLSIPQRLVYARTQRDSETLGWLIRLGPGENGAFLYGDRSLQICSLRESNSELAFTTAEDFG